MALYTPKAVFQYSSFSSFKNSHLGLKEMLQYIKEHTMQARRLEFKYLTPT